jgi:methyl-accepting chemotaxis protein
MKGVVVGSIKDYYISKKGQEEWFSLLEQIGLDRHKLILATTDFDDTLVEKIIDKMADSLQLKKEELLKELGKYFVTNSTQKLYQFFYKKHNSAKSFLLDMDKLHLQMTSIIKDARPPRFEFEEKDESTLTIKYKSHRNMLSYLEGALIGVGEVYNENLAVSKIGNDKVEIKFK